jgi:hypothetical protein
MVDKSLTAISYLIFSGFLLLTSCETVLDLELHAIPKLTIISNLNPGNPAGQRVYVYASQSPTDSSKFYTPEDLVVNVTEVESNTTFLLDTSIYQGKTTFKFPAGFIKAGYTYSITAFAPGFDIVQATTFIPRPSTISNLEIKDVKIEQSDAHEFKNIIRYKLSFNIDNFESNYYHLVFYNEYNGLDNLFIVDPEPSDDYQAFIQHYEYGVLIDGQDLEINKPLVFDFQDWEINNNNLIRVYVELRTINEEYYKYHSSLTRQLIVLQDPFAEPVTIFNNIEGGFGNFSGFSSNITSSDLPQ